MTAPRILVIDNVDSFTFMLVDYLVALGAEVAVKRNDALTPDEAIDAGADGILISPGPGTPEQAGISVELAAACIERCHPLLGVCLGHQAIALACGSIPMGFIYAAIGARGQENPGAALALSVLVPLLLYGGVHLFLRRAR